MRIHVPIRNDLKGIWLSISKESAGYRLSIYTCVRKKIKKGKKIYPQVLLCIPSLEGTQEQLAASGWTLDDLRWREIFPL